MATLSKSSTAKTANGMSKFPLFSTATVFLAFSLTACGGGGGGGSSSADARPSSVANAESVQLATDSATPLTESAPAMGDGCTMVGSLPHGGILALDTSETPRANATAELLSIEASQTTVAERGTYERVVAELQGIRATHSERTSFEALPCNRASSIIIGFDQTATNTELSTQYSHLLKARTDNGSLLPSFVILEFDGLYNTNRIAAEYEKLENVDYAEPDYMRADSSDICLEILPDDSHLYIFDDAEGDCAAGCLSHEYSGFMADADGNITDLGSYDPQLGGVQPDWFATASECRGFL